MVPFLMQYSVKIPIAVAASSFSLWTIWQKKELCKLQKFKKKMPKNPFFQGNPCKKISNWLSPRRNFSMLLPGTGKPPTCSRLLPTRADQSRPGPTRADQKTKMADDCRCLVPSSYSLLHFVVSSFCRPPVPLFPRSVIPLFRRSYVILFPC